MPNSGTVTASRLCHRHLVILPLFLSVVVFSSFFSLPVPEVPPEVSSRKGEDILFQDDGMITVHRDTFSLYGMHGAFTVSEPTGHVSVAALTTPVLVREGDAVSIVPVGFQWRSDVQGALLPTPSAFHYARLQELRESSSSANSARWQAPLVFPDVLRLPAARRRREDAVTMGYLAALARQIARGRPVARMTRDAVASAALASEDGYRIVPSLLAQVQDAPLDRAALFPFLFLEEEGALLALFHPAFRDHASALLPPGALSADARAAYRLSFPRSDFLPQALAASTFSRWEDDVGVGLSEAGSQSFFAAVLSVIEDVVRVCARRGYVERAQRYTAAMQHFATLVELTPELRERMDALRSASVTGFSSSAASSNPSSSSVKNPDEAPELVERELVEWVEDPAVRGSELVPVVWEDLRKRATADLTAHGGMFIAQTVMEPLSPVSVRVISLVLATANGDELFDFVYDTERQEVSDVLRGSERYPYAVPLPRFIEWVRGE